MHRYGTPPGVTLNGPTVASENVKFSFCGCVALSAVPITVPTVASSRMVRLWSEVEGGRATGSSVMVTGVEEVAKPFVMFSMYEKVDLSDTSVSCTSATVMLQPRDTAKALGESTAPQLQLNVKLLASTPPTLPSSVPTADSSGSWNAVTVGVGGMGTCVTFTHMVQYAVRLPMPIEEPSLRTDRSTLYALVSFHRNGRSTRSWPSHMPTENGTLPAVV